MSGWSGLPYVASPTGFLVLWWGGFRGTPAWVAMLEWLRFHGVAEHDYLAAVDGEHPIVRNEAQCRVEYTGFAYVSPPRNVEDIPNVIRCEGNEPVYERRHVQGETPPMPWPPEVEVRYHTDLLHRPIPPER